MKMLTTILNYVFWVMLGIVLFEANSGLRIDFIHMIIGNLALVTYIVGLVTMAIDTLAYTGVFRGTRRNSTFVICAVVTFIWTAFVLVFYYAIKMTDYGWVRAIKGAGDVIVLGFVLPFFVYRGYKR